MIKLLLPEDYDANLIHDLRVMNDTISMGWSIRPMEHYILDYSWIINQLPKPDKKLKILDAGCGLGALQFYCEPRYTTFSIDKEHYAAQIHRGNPRIQFIQGDLLDTPFKDNYFDYIVSCSAFEHNNPDTFTLIMEEMSRILKPSGKIIFTVISRGEKLFNEGNWWAFSSDAIRTYFLVPSLRLEGHFDNYDQFDDIYFNKFLPMFKEQPYPYMPLGVVLVKNG